MPLTFVIFDLYLCLTFSYYTYPVWPRSESKQVELKEKIVVSQNQVGQFKTESRQDLEQIA